MTIAIKEQPFKALALRPCYCGYLHPERQSATQRVQAIAVALVLLSSLFASELAIAAWSHSLSLLADAGHLFADVAALSMTLIAAWLAHRPATNRATFGHQRIEILAALLNGLSLLAIAGFVTWESLERFNLPQTVLGLPMLMGASMGLLINCLNILLLHRQSQDNLNMKAAFLHIVADAASSVGVIVASLTIYFWHWMWMDTTASLLVAGLTCLSALPLVKESLEILLEYSPASIDPTKVRAALTAFDTVERVENLRIWSITSGQMALSAQVQVSNALDAQDRDHLLRALHNHLREAFKIQEAVLQLQGESLYEKATFHPLLHQSLIDHVFEKTRTPMS